MPSAREHCSKTAFSPALFESKKSADIILVSTGPYAWVRHPGYAGALLTYFATPLLLDSPWTFLPVIFIAVLLVIRTFLEDRTLQEELPGYKEYATQNTKIWLIPNHDILPIRENSVLISSTPTRLCGC